ncbi:MAG: dihydrodipicolinate synthase family protein [Pseudomonadota bacterium]|nr:dihydrodipicolinate synthase family protein [Pseudomonadota bacterium]
MDRFDGVLAPVITPFTKDLLPDGERLTAHCQWLVNQGVGLAVFGTNSEANSLSIDEKLALLDELVTAGIDPDLMMPGTGCCALSDTVRLTAHAVTLGSRGTLMLPPFYYKDVPEDGLFAFYSEVIQRVAEESLRIYLYHIPAVSQIPISLRLIERLAKTYPSIIAGIKDSSGDWSNTQALNELAIDDFRVFCGAETFLLQNMQSGGAGCISATVNVYPSPIKDLYENWQAEDAEQKQDHLNEIRQIFQRFPMIPSLKTATSIYSGDSSWLRVRPPLLSLTDDQQTSLKDQLESAGFEMPGL